MPRVGGDDDEIEALSAEKIEALIGPRYNLERRAAEIASTLMDYWFDDAKLQTHSNHGVGLVFLTTHFMSVGESVGFWAALWSDTGIAETMGAIAVTLDVDGIAAGYLAHEILMERLGPTEERLEYTPVRPGSSGSVGHVRPEWRQA